MKLHFLRCLVSHGYTYIHLCRTHEMFANALTKVENKRMQSSSTRVR